MSAAAAEFQFGVAVSSVKTDRSQKTRSYKLDVILDEDTSVGSIELKVTAGRQLYLASWRNHIHSDAGLARMLRERCLHIDGFLTSALHQFVHHVVVGRGLVPASALFTVLALGGRDDRASLHRLLNYYERLGFVPDDNRRMHTRASVQTIKSQWFTAPSIQHVLSQIEHTGNLKWVTGTRSMDEAAEAVESDWLDSTAYTPKTKPVRVQVPDADRERVLASREAAQKTMDDALAALRVDESQENYAACNRATERYMQTVNQAWALSYGVLLADADAAEWSPAHTRPPQADDLVPCGRFSLHPRTKELDLALAAWSMSKQQLNASLSAAREDLMSDQ